MCCSGCPCCIVLLSRVHSHSTPVFLNLEKSARSEIASDRLCSQSALPLVVRRDNLDAGVLFSFLACTSLLFDNSFLYSLLLRSVRDCLDQRHLACCAVRSSQCRFRHGFALWHPSFSDFLRFCQQFSCVVLPVVAVLDCPVQRIFAFATNAGSGYPLYSSVLFTVQFLLRSSRICILSVRGAEEFF